MNQIQGAYSIRKRISFENAPAIQAINIRGYDRKLQP
jgi:hypothetical protein